MKTHTALVISAVTIALGTAVAPVSSAINPTRVEYVNVYSTASQSFEPSDRNNLPGKWRVITFDSEYADADGNHANPGPYVANGTGFVSGTLDLRVQDCATNTELQVRSFESDSAGTRKETHEGPEVYTAHQSHPDTAVDGSYPRNTHVRIPIFSYINSGHRLGFEISQWPSSLSFPDCRVVKAQFQATITA